MNGGAVMEKCLNRHRIIGRVLMLISGICFIIMLGRPNTASLLLCGFLLLVLIAVMLLKPIKFEKSLLSLQIELCALIVCIFIRKAARNARLFCVWDSDRNHFSLHTAPGY